MKIQTSTDFCTGQTSLWLWEEDGAGANHYWFNQGKMEAVHLPKGSFEFNEVKPFMVLPHREYKQVMEALATFLQAENIEPKNKATLESVIEAKDDHLALAEEVLRALMKKI